MTIVPQIERQLLDAAHRRARRPFSRALSRLREASVSEFGSASGYPSPSLRASVRPGPLLARRPRQALGFGVLALVLAGALLGFTLPGGGGDHPSSFDVLAAVNRALTPGTGVQYIEVEEEERKHPHEVHRAQYWSTANPWRERAVQEFEEVPCGEPRRLVRREIAIEPGSNWLEWRNTSPDLITRSRNRTKNGAFDAAFIRSNYKSKTLRLVGKTTVDGRPAYRLEVLGRPGPGIPPNAFLVAANTFAPIQILTYARNRQGRIVVSRVTRYRAYEELPATPQNLALLPLATHPGARVVDAPEPQSGPLLVCVKGRLRRLPSPAR